MDTLDKKLLNRLQIGIPLVPNPFMSIANEFSLSEKECTDKIAQLKEKKIIRQISAIFDTKSLGYSGMLVAMQFSSEEDLTKAADIINRHPGVSHNYERNHTLNLWFTIAAPSHLNINRHIQKLSDLTGAEETFLLPTLKLFKIGVSLNLGEQKKSIERTTQDEYYSEKNQVQDNSLLTPLDKMVIKEIQADIPLIHSPFLDMVKRCNISEKKLLDTASQLQKKGFLKRFSAVLHHKEAGFTANVMGVWEVPADKIKECGQIMASYRAVSHCYHRPTYPHWPYSLFTMIHGKSKEECEAVIYDISKKTGVTKYSLLKSLREFKKVRIKYFTGDIQKWDKDNVATGTEK